MLDLMLTNLSSPMILAFLLGILAVLAKSDLKFPDALYSSLSIVLLLAIGLKGGVALRHSALGDILAPVLGTLFLGISTPLVSYCVARRLFAFSRVDSAALAAHYGSVSVVTFFAALSFTEQLGLGAEQFMPALVALLEIPAIFIGLFMAKVRAEQDAPIAKAFHEILTGKSIILLVGGVGIGVITGGAGFAKVAPLFEGLFPGLLVLFLLEIGMVCGARLRDLSGAGAALICFGILVPVLNSSIGAFVGTVCGLSAGGTFVLATMAASASYIAAPAAVRIALPSANPSIYVTASLAITFPFNLSFGLPLYQIISEVIHGALK